jgi:hypothetical protein
VSQDPPVAIEAPSEVDVANFAANLLLKPGASRRTVLSGVQTTLGLLTERSKVEAQVRTGLRKVRPDRARHDSFYSLAPLWAHMKRTPWHALPIDGKRMRLVVSLSLDTFARNSDLANLFAEKVEFCTGAASFSGVPGMHIWYAAPKHGGVFTDKLWVQAHLRDPELCSVRMMFAWLNETREHRWTSVTMTIGGTNRAFTPVFYNLQAKKRGHPLTADAVGSMRKAFLAEAGVDTRVFTAHSLRGASVTAALLAGDGSDLWKETLRATGRWGSLPCMMKHYCIPTGVIPISTPPFPTCVTDAVRRGSSPGGAGADEGAVNAHLNALWR